MPRTAFSVSVHTPGGFLRSIRIKNKKSQKDVSQQCRDLGLADIHVSSMELGLGGRKVLSTNIDKIADVYKLSEDEKKQLEGLVERNSDGERSSCDEFRLFYELMQLPRDVRKRIIAAANAYDSVNE